MSKQKLSGLKNVCPDVADGQLDKLDTGRWASLRTAVMKMDENGDTSGGSGAVAGSVFST